MSDQNLKKIKGFGDGCLKEVKAKLAEYGIEDAVGNDQEPTSTKETNTIVNRREREKNGLCSLKRNGGST